eukprot:3576800-Rhodomonas_salina.1
MPSYCLSCSLRLVLIYSFSCVRVLIDGLSYSAADFPALIYWFSGTNLLAFVLLLLAFLVLICPLAGGHAPRARNPPRVLQP